MFIKENYYNQKFILISATPQIEMEQILKALNIFNCFDKVYGSPNQKEEVIKLFKYNNKLKKYKASIPKNFKTYLEKFF